MDPPLCVCFAEDGPLITLPCCRASVLCLTCSGMLSMCPTCRAPSL